VVKFIPLIGLALCSTVINAQPCFKSTEKSCPTHDPVTCGQTPCAFTPTTTPLTCESVVNGVVQGQYTCPENALEARVKTMSGNVDCSTNDDAGEYALQGTQQTVTCGEFRYCLYGNPDPVCAVTTAIRSEGDVAGTPVCHWKIMEAHCVTDTEGEWSDTDELVADYTYKPCDGFGSNCPVGGGSSGSGG
jgi:hypothetical protein